MVIHTHQRREACTTRSPLGEDAHWPARGIALIHPSHLLPVPKQENTCTQNRYRYRHTRAHTRARAPTHPPTHPNTRTTPNPLPPVMHLCLSCVSAPRAHRRAPAARSAVLTQRAEPEASGGLQHATRRTGARAEPGNRTSNAC